MMVAKLFSATMVAMTSAVTLRFHPLMCHTEKEGSQAWLRPVRHDPGERLTERLIVATAGQLLHTSHVVRIRLEPIDADELKQCLSLVLDHQPRVARVDVEPQLPQPDAFAARGLHVSLPQVARACHPRKGLVNQVQPSLHGQCPDLCSQPVHKCAASIQDLCEDVETDWDPWSALVSQDIGRWTPEITWGRWCRSHCAWSLCIIGILPLLGGRGGVSPSTSPPPFAFGRHTCCWR